MSETAMQLLFPRYSCCKQSENKPRLDSDALLIPLRQILGLYAAFFILSLRSLQYIAPPSLVIDEIILFNIIFYIFSAQNLFDSMIYTL